MDVASIYGVDFVDLNVAAGSRGTTI